MQTNIEKVKEEIAGKKNQTAKKIGYLLNGSEIELNQADYKRVTEMAPSLVLGIARSGLMMNIRTHGKPVYRGSNVPFYKAI